jgi:rhodanese-related sulfurtransferase
VRLLVSTARILGVGGALAALVFVVRETPVLEPAATACVAPDGPASVRWISQNEARELYGRPEVVFVDARDELEYEAGHVAGSVSAPIANGALERNVVPELRGSSILVTYCDTADDCSHSTRLAQLLAAQGFADVRILEGGIEHWVDNGYPAEAGECPRCP